MPASGKAPPSLVDTSAAVALVMADHDHHETTFAALAHRRLGLAGHAAFEMFSVLTRLPPPLRRSAPTVARLLAAEFPETRFLGAAASRALLGQLAGNIMGGAVYDGLVGACANEHGLTLVTRDRRALETYRALDVRVELLP
ncbi:MAG TPA: type II toxin-antitoxin system VapC family toxin [Mycobacteriales bacterium]|nr:type II toxin-antitoxin system VapC family toxin [Mycobacteriales bacterium]